MRWSLYWYRNKSGHDKCKEAYKESQIKLWKEGQNRRSDKCYFQNASLHVKRCHKHIINEHEIKWLILGQNAHCNGWHSTTSSANYKNIQKVYTVTAKLSMSFIEYFVFSSDPDCSHRLNQRAWSSCTSTDQFVPKDVATLLKSARSCRGSLLNLKFIASSST